MVRTRISPHSTHLVVVWRLHTMLKHLLRQPCWLKSCCSSISILAYCWQFPYQKQRLWKVSKALLPPCQYSDKGSSWIICTTVKPDDDLYCACNFKLTSHTSEHGKSQYYCLSGLSRYSVDLSVLWHTGKNRVHFKGGGTHRVAL